MIRIEKMMNTIAVKNKTLFTYLALYIAYDKRNNKELDKKVVNGLNFFKFDQNEFNEIVKDFKNKLKEDKYKLIKKIEKRRSLENIYYNTSDLITHLSNYILGEVSGPKILDLCSGQGNYLIEHKKKYPKSLLYGQELINENVLISEIKLHILGYEAKIKTGDVITDNKFIENNKFKKFDKIFSNFPLNHRLKREVFIDGVDEKLYSKTGLIYDTRASADWLFVLMIINMLEEKGKGVALMSEGSFFKKTDFEIRKKLVENGYIESIIKLPERSLLNSNLDTSLMVLSENNKTIKMFNIKDEVKEIEDIEKIYKLYKTEGKEIPIEEIRENNYDLRVEQVLNKDKINLINPTKLKDLTKDMVRGSQATKKTMEKLYVSKILEDDYYLVNLGDISEDGDINKESLERFRPIDNSFDRYKIEDGDLLISARGTNYKVAVFENKNNLNYVASGNLIIIRLDKNKINPYYLKLFLDSKDGTLSLDQIQTGGVIKVLNPSSLGDMLISLIPFEKQEKLANEYLKIREENNTYLKKINNNLKKINELYEDYKEKEYK